MMKGGHGSTKYDSDGGAFVYTSHAPKSLSNKDKLILCSNN